VVTSIEPSVPMKWRLLGAAIGLAMIALWAAACSSSPGSKVVEEDGLIEVDAADVEAGDGEVHDDLLDLPPDVVSPDGVSPDVLPETTEEVIEVPDVVVMQGVIGAACTEPGQCTSGLCATILPGGYCTQGCDLQGCPSGSVCREVNGFPFCLQACGSKDECRSGYSCIDGACNIACRNLFDCADGKQCIDGVCAYPPPNLGTGATCQYSRQCISGVCLRPEDGGVCAGPCPCTLADWTCRPLLPVDSDTPMQVCGPGGTFTATELTITGGNPRRFNVGSDVVSFMIVAEASTRDGYLWIENLRRPNGTLAAGSLDLYGTGFTAPFRSTINSGHGSLVFPQNADPALQLMSGEWSFDVGRYASNIDRVRVFLKRGTGSVAGASFDVNIFIAQGAVSGLSATTAPSNTYMQTVLNGARQNYFGPRNVVLGQVRYYDLPNTYAVLDNADEMYEMFANRSTVGVNGAINVFFVRDLRGDLSGAAGVAGGIPGPVGVNGTGGSGVVVQAQSSTAMTTDIMVHELGHYFGFYHVTEISRNANNQQVNDVIADTPNCPTPVGEFSYHTYHDCMSNVMFPVVLTGTGVVQSFSSTQGQIMRLNPRGR